MRKRTIKNEPHPMAAQEGNGPTFSLRVPEAARAIGVSVSFLYDLMESGRLPFVKLNACRLLRAQDIEALLARNLQVKGEGPEAA